MVRDLLWRRGWLQVCFLLYRDTQCVWNLCMTRVPLVWRGQIKVKLIATSTSRFISDNADMYQNLLCSKILERIFWRLWVVAPWGVLLLVVFRSWVYNCTKIHFLMLLHSVTIKTLVVCCARADTYYKNNDVFCRCTPNTLTSKKQQIEDKWLLVILSTVYGFLSSNKIITTISYNCTSMAGLNYKQVP